MFSWLSAETTAAAPVDDDEVREAVSAAVAETKAALAQVHRLALRKVATEAISRAARPLLGVPATGAESRPDLRFPGSRVLAST